MSEAIPTTMRVMITTPEDKEIQRTNSWVFFTSIIRLIEIITIMLTEVGFKSLFV